MRPPAKTETGRADVPGRANAAIARAKELLAAHIKTREDGDKDPKWTTWYDPAKRRAGSSRWLKAL